MQLTLPSLELNRRVSWGATRLDIIIFLFRVVGCHVDGFLTSGEVKVVVYGEGMLKGAFFLALE